MIQKVSWYFHSNPLWATIIPQPNVSQGNIFCKSIVKFVAEWYCHQESSITTGATEIQKTIAEKILNVLVDRQKIVRKVTFCDYKMNIVLDRRWKEEYMSLFETVIGEACTEIVFIKAIS